MKRKPSRFPVIIIEGGLVQGYLQPLGKKGWVAPEYELLDFDMLEQDPPEDIVDRWNSFTPELQAYIQKFHEYEYGLFQEAIASVDARD